MTMFKSSMIISSLLFSSGLFAQTISSSMTEIETTPTKEISFDLSYLADSKELTGLGLSLHFDSKQLEFVGFSDNFSQDLMNADTTAQIDNHNNDNDEKTDKKASIAWLSVSGKWPGEGETMPLSLVSAHFKALASAQGETHINISGSPAAGNEFTAQAITVMIKP